LPVEALFPQGRERFELTSSSGWSGVLGIDAVGGPPHSDFTDEGGARLTSRWCPDWPGVTSAGVILNLTDEVGDELGSRNQVGPPDGIGMQRWWNAREPGQRTWIGRRERCEAPFEHGGHVACGSEVAIGGDCQQVAEGVLAGLRRQVEEVYSQGWPGGFSGESGEVLVRLVELNRPGFSGGWVLPSAGLQTVSL